MDNNSIILIGKYILEGNIVLKTGLHIGGTSETLKIGGADNPVIRDKNGDTFIPGSSLKGKIRSLLEISRLNSDNFKYGQMNGGQPCSCGTCPICKIFGPHNADDIKEPNRIIVRDSYLLGSTFESTEVKPENTIDRITCAAKPRFIERVTTGNSFKFEIVFNEYYKDDKELLKLFLRGMVLLEDDYLGGNGTRGSGKIKFEDMSLEYRSKEYYEGTKNSKSIMSNTTELSEVISKLNEKNSE